MSNFRFIAAYITRIKGLLLVTVTAMVIESNSYLVAIALQKVMIDDVILRDGPYSFWFIFGAIAAAYGVHSLFITLSSILMYRSATGMRRNLSRDFVLRLHRIPIQKLKNERTAKYIYQFATDVGDIGQISNMVAGDVTRIIKQGVAIVVLLFLLRENLWLVALLIVVSLFYVKIGRRLAPLLKAASGAVNTARSDILVHLEEGVASTREVVAFHRESWELGRLHKAFLHYFGHVMQEGKLLNRQLIGSHLLKWSATLIVLIIGGYSVLTGRMSVGLLVISLQLSNELMEMTNELYDRLMKMPSYWAAAERLRQVYEVEQIPLHGEPLNQPLWEVRLENVVFGYQDREPVLCETNLAFPLGGKLAFVGASGSGKSTLVGLLAQFYEPRSGRIVVNGQSLPAWKRSDWMRKIALVPQEPYFFPDTIRTNLILGLEAIGPASIIEACRVAQIHEYIESLPQGYDTVIGERGVTLSGGQRQRLAIARALLRNAELLILDEATSALDMETERRLQEDLDQYRKGKTTIVIAHRLSTIRNADRIFVFSQGTVIEQGTYGELMRVNGAFAALERISDTNPANAPTLIGP